MAPRSACRYDDAMMRPRPLRTGILALPLLALAWPGPASAEAAHHPRHHAPAHLDTTPKLLGGAHSWSAYVYEEHEGKGKSGKVCYLIGDPLRVESGGLKRKAPIAMVTHRPAENVTNVVSFTEGYPLRLGSDVTIDIDGKSFDLFTKDDSAWAKNSATDKSIVDTMIKGKQAIVKGTPQKGSPTTDIYSLAGFKDALEKIDKACDVKR
jgi:Invasion associated locus B (IalB) protein